MADHMPALIRILSPDGKTPSPMCITILDGAYTFSRMLHGSKATSGGTTDTFYRAFVPEIGQVLQVVQVELTKRCQKASISVFNH